MTCRRGNVFDTFVIIIPLFAIAMTMVITALVINVVSTDFVNNSDIPQRAQDIIQVGDDQYSGVMDFWIALFLVGFPLISATLAFFTNTNPIFFWVSLVIVILVVLYGASLKVLWSELSEDTLIDDVMSSMPMTDFIFNNYTLYSLFVFVVVAMGTYVKVSRSGGVRGF